MRLTTKSKGKRRRKTLNSEKNIQNKKGSISLDIMLFVILIVVVAIGFVVIKMLVSKLNIITADIDIPQEQKDVVQNVDSDYTNFADGAFILLYVILTLALWFSAFLVNTNRIFFIIILITMVFYCIITMILHNIFFDITSDNELSTYANQFHIIPFFVQNILIISIVNGFITAVILYSSLKNSG